MGSQRVGHDWVTNTHTHTHTHTSSSTTVYKGLKKKKKRERAQKTWTKWNGITEYEIKKEKQTR